jgi:isopenicillin N synthase-like dioxygenase
MHRVVNPPLDEGRNAPRLSIAFFNHPNWDTMIECVAAPGQAKYAPVMSGDYRDLKYAKTGLAPTTTV